MPASILSIDSSAFSDCGITAITVDECNENFSSQDGVLYNKDKTTLLNYPIGRFDTDFKIPGSVTKIGDRAFCSCTSLKSISIPNSVTRIGELAFFYCASLTSINIPEGVESIGECAFCECISLISITVDENNLYYSSENGVLYNKSKSELIHYPVAKTDDCLTIPAEVTNVDFLSLMDAEHLKRINVSEDNEEFFSQNGVLFNKSGTELLLYSEGKNENEYSIPESVTTICESAFGICGSLKSIIIPKSVTDLGGNDLHIGVFYECASLNNITVDENNPCYSSQNGVLYNKTKSRLIRYPVAKTDTCFTIPAVVTDIDIYSKLTDAKKLVNIYVSDDNVNFSSQNGVLFNKSGTELVLYPAGRNESEYYIPEGVTTIGESAFSCCVSLKSIIIPEGVKQIKEFAFDRCSSLSNIIIPEGVTIIELYAFCSCHSLKSIKLPDSLTSKAEDLYFDCTSLTDIIYKGKHYKPDEINSDFIDIVLNADT